MKREMKRLSYLFTVLFMMSCSTVPITGRKQLRIIPTDQMLATSFKQYGDFINKNRVIGQGSQAAMVQSVGRRIQMAVETYFADHNLSEQLEGYQWEFRLVENDQMNAWCMPGGKVVVYSGILPVAKDDTGLAVVLGHEIAHAVAGHGNERMSQGLLANMGGMALQTALENKSTETQQLWMQAFGIGANVGVLLPFSRLHESEADHLGLIFMAMAGYDPHEAVAFWERMNGLSQGVAPPEILSTHPADENRIMSIQKILPEAMEYFQNYNPES